MLSSSRVEGLGVCLSQILGSLKIILLSVYCSIHYHHQAPCLFSCSSLSFPFSHSHVHFFSHVCISTTLVPSSFFFRLLFCTRTNFSSHVSAHLWWWFCSLQWYMTMCIFVELIWLCFSLFCLTHYRYGLLLGTNRRGS